MKKIIMVVILLVMSLTVMAQAKAEVKVVGANVLEWVDNTCYYITVEYHDGTTEVIEVDENSYNGIIKDLEAAESEYNSRWYVKVQNWCVGAWDTISFWN